MALSLDEALGMSQLDESDKSIHIDLATRQVVIPESEKLFGVESDDAVEVKHIVIDGRYTDAGKDISELSWRVNFRNANGDKNVFPVTKVTAGDDSVEFDWIIRRSVVAYKGSIDFVVCAFGKDSDGKLTPEWNSTLGHGDALEGLEVDAEDIGGDEILDELKSLQVDMKALSDSAAKSASDAKAALDAIPEDYTELSEDVEQLKEDVSDIRDVVYTTEERTDLLQEYTSGMVRVIPNGTCYVGGKNFLIFQDSENTINGITCTVENGIITLNGTSSSVTRFWFPQTITLDTSLKYISQIFANRYDYNKVLILYEKDQYGTHALENKINAGTDAYTVDVINSELRYFCLYIPAGTTIDNLIIKPMLTIGDIESSYAYGTVPELCTAEISVVVHDYYCVQGSCTVFHMYEKAPQYQNLEGKPTLNGVEILGEKQAEDYRLKRSDNSKSINQKYRYPRLDASIATAGNGGTSQSISGTLYPAKKNNSPSEEVNDIFSYSVQVVGGSKYPADFGVVENVPRKLGFAIDFLFSGCSFEIKGRAGYRVVVVADGMQLFEQYVTEATGGFRYVSVTFSKPVENSHIQLYFYGNFMGIVSGGTVQKYAERRMLLVSDGDSIVEGSTIGSASGRFKCWAATVSEVLNFNLYNTGVGGSGYVKTGNSGEPNMLDRFDEYVKPYTPDVFISSAGLNDSNLELNDIKPNIDAYWNKVAELNPKYVIVVSPYSPTVEPNATVKEIADYLREVAEKHKYSYIDLISGKTYDALGNIISEYSYGGIMTESHRNEWYSEYISGESTDATHPNAAGHRWIGQYIANEIFKICADAYGLVI